MSNDTVAIALELYSLKAGQPRAYAYSYERNTEAEKVIEAAREVFNHADGTDGRIHALAGLARSFSALDRRDGR